MKPSNVRSPAASTSACQALELNAEICQSVGDVLALAGDKWSILVIYTLSKERLRFTELKHRLGTISQKVLTATLRNLERDGYLTRIMNTHIPRRVDYELTAMGYEALSPITTLAEWAIEKQVEVRAARHRFDQAKVKSIENSRVLHDE
jgi:DNA-binding HxlR family transcriptional regulator